MSARTKVVIAAAAAVAVVAAGVAVWLVAPWSAGDQAVATSPFAVAGRGASVPFVEHEAEGADTNATVIGPDRTAKTLAGEASGRRAVTLSRTGDYVEFTLTKPANAVNVRLSIPDSSDGVGQDATLSLYVDGVDAGDLDVTSRYTWFYGGFPFSNGPANGNPHHRYDESRRLLDRVLPQGTTVRLQKDSADIAESYTVDLVDFEEVAPPIAQPPASLSVVEFGADPSGVKDSGAAIARAIAAGRQQGREVYLPAGTFQVNQHLVVDQVTLRGAGMWHTELRGDGVGVYGKPAPDTETGGGSTAVHVRDFAIFGEVTERIDTAQVNGIGGAMGGGSVVANLWIQHTKVGMWFDGPFSGLTVTGNRIINMTADGLNLHRGISDTVVENNFLRGTGDDGLAAWSDQYPNHDNIFRYNTVVAPLLANGIAIYGGRDNQVTDNVIADTHIEGAGIQVANRFSGTTFLEGTVTIARNTTLRAGSVFAGVQPQVGAVWLFAKDGPITAKVVLTDNELLDSTFSGLLLFGAMISDVTVDGLVADGSGTFGIQAQSLGTGTFSRTRVTRSGAAAMFTCEALPFTVKGETAGLTESTFCGEFPAPTYQFDGDLPVHPTGAGAAAVPAPPARTPSGVVEGPAGNLAQGATFEGSSTMSGFPASAAGDGDPNTYWESVSDAFPQTLTIDLGGVSKVKSITVRIPPDEAWLTRTQTIAVATSVDGASFSGASPARTYVFDPATGNTVTITIAATDARYLRLTVTGNTGWPAAQLGEVAVFA